MKQIFGIIDRAWLWIIGWLIVMIAAITLFFVNVRYSIQFTGWVELVVDAQTIDQSTVDTIKQSLVDWGFGEQNVSVWEKQWFATLLIQTRLSGDNQVEGITTLMQSTLKDTWIIAGEEDILELAIIGPSIGDYIKKSAKSALITGTIMMAIYILFAFAGMRQLVSPLMLGVITVFTMLFDVSIPAWAYGIMMWMNNVIQVDTVFIIALLTVMWYSVNDTIVIFDRVRENFADKQKALEDGKTTSKEIFELSLWQTMRRSIGTSLSTLLVVIAMFIFWTWVLKTFAFTLWMWVLAGTFSSIFLAAPLAYLASKKKLAAE